jgi:ribosomal-protein-alanine N-acetyltransferase
MLNVDFSIFPSLTTERLLLRNLSPDDLEAIHRLRCDESVNIMIGRKAPSALIETRQFISKIEGLVHDNQCIYWVVSLKEDRQLLGTVCCWNFDVQNGIVELGYEMLPEFRGKGIMTEAIKKVMEYAFGDLNARLITAFPSALNTNSVSLLKKIGFQPDDKSYNNSHTEVEKLLTYTYTF